MSDLRQPVLGLGEQPSPWTPSPFGMLDHGDPALQNTLLGGTPGTTGLHDPGDPLKNPALGGLVPAAGGKVDSDAATMALAVEIFRASKSAKTPMGIRILAVLDKGLRTRSFSYADIGPAGDCDTDAGTIRITRVYERDPAQTAVWLAHEAYHIAVKDDELAYVDEEVESRMIQGEFWVELESPGVTLPDGRQFKLKAEGKMLPAAYARDQIVDWVVDQYKNESGFKITLAWIMTHKADWKGLKNRTAFTREWYARVLVDSQPTGAFDPRPIDPKVAETLLEVIESTNRLEQARLVLKVGKPEVTTILEKVPATAKPRVAALVKAGVL